MKSLLRRSLAIARAETYHLLREPRTLVVIFVQPVMLLILYGYAISFDLYNIPFVVWDQDHSNASRQFVHRLTAENRGGTLLFLGGVDRPDQIDTVLSRGVARFALVIPDHFARDLDAGHPITLQALFDAADSNTAGVAAGYLSAAIQSQNGSLVLEAGSRLHGAALLGSPLLGGDSSSVEPIDLRWRVFYNPDLDSRRFIIPGLIAILLTFVAASLTSTTLTRERELGSMESLLTSPVSAPDLIIGKLAPYIVVAAGDIVLVLLMGGFVFGCWPRGNLLTLASFSFLFLLGMLAIGMVVSAVAPTQMLALQLALLVSFLPNFFLTGFAFPRSNMPWILQVLSWPLPATQYLIAIRGVFLKGIGWSVLWPQGLWMLATTLFLLQRAIAFTKRSLKRGLG